MALLELSELEQVSPFFKGEKGHRRARFLLKLFQVDKVEASYAPIEHLHSTEASGEWLRLQNVKYTVRGLENLEKLPEGAFITVSNHPIGTVDGIVLIDFMARIRPDYKVMVNKFLARLRVIEEHFIMVTPTGAERTAPTADSISGVRAALAHVKEGHPLGLFPSGAVSDLKLGRRPVVQMPDGSSYTEPRVRDRDWQMSIVRFIQKAGVPVVPIRFFDGNTPGFYRLGLIDWRVRLLRQPAEVVNKGGKPFRLGVGEIITPEQIKSCNSLEELRTLLRGAVYSQQLP